MVRPSPRALARLQLLGSAVCFGLMAVLARRLSRGPGGFTPGQLAVVRFVVGAAVSVLAFRLRPGLHRPRDLRLLWTRGFSGGIVVVLYFLALARVPAGEAGMLYNLFPVAATAMSIFAFGERPTVHLLIGLAAATAGVVLVLGGGTLSLGLGLGDAFAVGAALFAAFSSVVIRAMRATENAPTIFFYFCLGGLPIALPFALDAWPRAGAGWWLAVLMALAAHAAQVLMSEAYGTLTIGEAAVWLQLTPLAQYLLAWPLLGESVTPAGFAGILIGVAGITWATVRGHRATPAPAPASPGG
jgi:drug/metabolite transporter (DMT)-like permease